MSETDNPFAAPRPVAEDAVGPSEPAPARRQKTRGPWRDRDCLVLRAGDPPGDRCWVTGQATDRRMRIVLKEPDALGATLAGGIVGAAVAAAMRRPVMKVDAPISAAGARRRWVRLGGVLAALGLMVALGVLYSAPMAFIACILAAVFLLPGIFWSRRLVHVRDAIEGHVWIVVHPEALRGLPEYDP